MMIALITTIPAIAVAARSICRKRSSRPSPRSPRTVSLRPPARISAPKAVMIASEPSPLSGFPPIHCAANMTKPSATANPGMNHFDLVICIEHLLHRRLEKACEGEREGQRRRVPLLLDRVDRLSRHVDVRGELPLRQASRRSEFPHSVFHLSSTLVTWTS